MLIDHAFMRRCGFLVFLALAFGCTKPNPLSCADGTCTDPAFPFCDVDGALDGTAGACIAVACEPATFDSCRGDLAITCNTAGTDFDLIQCERGCEDGIGCRLCDPNETACTNGTVATCDANGVIVDSQSCPLGCFESEPRCRDIVPSNELAAVLDSFDDPPDLDLSTGGSINTTTGVVTDGVVTFPIPSVLLSNAPNPSIRVLVVGSLRMGDVIVISDASAASTQVSPALAILAVGEVEILGTMTVSTGDLTTGSCVGGIAHVRVNETQNIDSASGSGGGGHATDGGNGGSGNAATGAVAGSKGASSGSPELVPLHGGCASGGAEENGTPRAALGVRGGGALQISSRISITITGTIDANGQPGFALQTLERGANVGGGGGGSVLLEAPSVEITATGEILARGGDGYGCAPPSICASGQVLHGAPGLGATATTVATDGGSSTTQFGSGGGGGGGLGRIRINTPDMTVSFTSASILEGEMTTGILETR